MAHYFPDITDSNKHFTKNVMISGNASKYSNFNTMSKNYFPLSTSGVGFTDFANGINDYHNYVLTSTSPYYQNATDNKDIGVNFAELDSGKRLCLAIPL